ncbi:hypothetical protein [Acidovorax sp. SUPP3334]|uniref:hypothetical protein n=1 Tax=Acidovorax sp. SUPP3334 TaxID=2920881 RepID=UPI0023DE2DCB|nr:hypothetical protein [Acidovorax sp. SUPP3334]GKT20876.1 hypothetical protein AVHM3334_02725 [Acidovorax sp. SUPP3334]
MEAIHERGQALLAGRLGFAVPVYALYYDMRDAFSNHWRRWLTHRFLDGYLGGRRYYELNTQGGIDNPDQRISASAKTSAPSPAAPRTSC